MRLLTFLQQILEIFTCRFFHIELSTKYGDHS